MAETTTSVMWFRRDLRLGDNPALLEAAADGDVLPLFVLDPALWGPSGDVRRAYLSASLRDLAGRIPLSVVRGNPVRRVVLAAREVGAERVHVAADFGPYGHRRDAAVEEALAEAGVELVRTGSPYAVAPGRVTTGADEPFQVFTPFSRAWAEHGWRDPVDPPRNPSWIPTLADTTDLPEPAVPDGLELPEAGEAAARRRWKHFLDRVADYDDDRDRPGVEGTSRMSVHLKYGEIHPRTMLADLGRLRSTGAATYRKELAWREFYADVLFARPDTARAYLKPELARMRYVEPGGEDSHFDAWRRGRTGFPIVDAGMRQLRATGWMHNRVRMVVAQLPGQGPAHRVAARRPPLPALAGRRRPRLQPARLAVDRGHAAPTRRRTSGSSTRPPRAASSTPTAPISGGGCPSSPTSRTRTTPPPTIDPGSATRSRSSTMRRSARRRCDVGKRSGAELMPTDHPWQG